MSYKNKTYVIFNADYPRDDGDIGAYNLMKAWRANEKIDFDFHNAHDLNNLSVGASEDQIRRKLRERFSDTKQVIVLVGEHTKNMYKFVRWEIEVAQKLDIPIIAVNLDKANGATGKTPPILTDNSYFLNVPFSPSKIKYAMDHFPAEYHRSKSEAPSDRFYDWSKVEL